MQKEIMETDSYLKAKALFDLIFYLNSKAELLSCH